MTVVQIPISTRKYIGKSTDIKPTIAAPLKFGPPTIGSTFYEHDTKLIFITYDGTNWVSKDPPSDVMLDIARERLVGLIHINKFGRNPDCAQAASSTAVNLGRSIWDGGIGGAVNWLAPTQSRVHQLKSSDTDDTSAGVGARTVQIFGLDADFALFNETLTLNGTANVATSSFTMVYRMIVKTAGATGWNEGDITVTADSDGTVTAKITAKNNQTLMTQYMIPVSKKGYMTNYSATLKKTGGVNKLADIFLMSMEFGEVWRIRDATSVATDGANSVPREFKPYKVFQAKELIQIIANPSADAQDISAGFDLILVND